MGQKECFLPIFLALTFSFYAGSGAVDLSITVPEPSRLPPFEIVVSIANSGSGTRRDSPPHKLAVDVVAGDGAECGSESVFNATEVQLTPQTEGVHWTLADIHIHVGAWSAGPYLLCAYVEDGTGQSLGTALQHIVVGAFQPTLEAMLLPSIETNCLLSHIQLVVDLGKHAAWGIRAREMALLQDAAVEVEIDGRMLSLEIDLKWRRRRTHLVSWNDMEMARAVQDQEGQMHETQPVVEVKHHACAACIGDSPQDLVAIMARSNAGMQGMIRHLHDSFAQAVTARL